MTIQIRISRIALFAVAVVLASATHAEAQRRAEPLPLDSLSRVRVTQRGEDRFRATFVSADSQVVVVRRGEERLELPRRSIVMLEASGGPLPLEGRAWRGTKRGFLGGALVGAVLGALVLTTEDGDAYISNEGAALIFLGTGITVGTVVGTVVGAALPGESWVPVPIPGQP